MSKVINENATTPTEAKEGYGKAVCCQCVHGIKMTAAGYSCFVEGVDTWSYDPVMGTVSKDNKVCSGRNTVGGCTYFKSRKLSLPTKQKSTDDSVEGGIRGIIVSQLGVNFDEVTPKAHVVDDLGADSLDLVQLAMAIEETFAISLPDEECKKLGTVADVYAYVSEKVSNE